MEAEIGPQEAQPERRDDEDDADPAEKSEETFH
jgi:hypothetical protein